jgi:hypothetical protein
MHNSTFPITIIEPKKSWVPFDFKEIWAYRELLYFLTKRDIKIRHRLTVLGGLWAIIQSAFSMIVFTLLLGSLAKIPLGLLLWTNISNPIDWASIGTSATMILLLLSTGVCYLIRIDKVFVDVV